MGLLFLHVIDSRFSAPAVAEVYDLNKDQAHHSSS